MTSLISSFFTFQVFKTKSFGVRILLKCQVLYKTLLGEMRFDYLFLLRFSYSKNLKGTGDCSHKINLQTSNMPSGPQVLDEDLVDHYYEL